MDKDRMLRVLCAAAEARTFKDAARDLHVSPQVVTRAITALEEVCGEPLFHRNTRGIRITAFGARYAAQARAVLAEMDALFVVPEAEPSVGVAGVVRVTVPRSLGPTVVPVLGRLGAAHPGLRLDVRLGDVRSNPVEDEIDVGIRLGHLPDGGLVARRAGKIAFRNVGTPALLRRCGPLRGSEALREVPVSVMLDHNSGLVWPWEFADGREWRPEDPAFVCDDVHAHRDGVLAGAAVGQLPHFLVDDDLEAGRLCPFLVRDAPSPWDVFVYRARTTGVPLRTRAVFDALLQAVRALLGPKLSRARLAELAQAVG